MKFLLVKQLISLAFFLTVVFASRRPISSDLESGKDVDLSDIESNDTVNDAVDAYDGDMVINDYEYLRPVPKVQFDNAFTIALTIFSIFKFLESNALIYKLIAFISISSLPIQLQYYFGYDLKLSCPLQLAKHQYEHRGDFVSFNRWLLAPLLWVTESILLLSEDDFNRLHLPSRSVILSIFFIQVLHYLGIIDILISCLTAPVLNKKL